MKKAIVASLLFLAPTLAFAGTYQYVTSAGELKTITASSEAEAYAIASDIAPNSGLMVVSDSTPVVTTSNTTVQTSLDLQSMSDSELRTLRSQITDELRSREVEDEPTGSTGGTTDTTTGSTDPLRLFNVVIERYDTDQSKDARIVYVWANQKVSSVTVNGESLSMEMQRHMTDSCYGGRDENCGGYAHRFRASSKFAPGEYTISIVSEGGETETKRVEVFE